jgi:hypothetical protein
MARRPNRPWAILGLVGQASRNAGHNRGNASHTMTTSALHCGMLMPKWNTHNSIVNRKKLLVYTSIALSIMVTTDRETIVAPCFDLVLTIFPASHTGTEALSFHPCDASEHSSSIAFSRIHESAYVQRVPVPPLPQRLLSPVRPKLVRVQPIARKKLAGFPITCIPPSRGLVVESVGGSSDIFSRLPCAA